MLKKKFLIIILAFIILIFFLTLFFWQLPYYIEKMECENKGGSLGYFREASPDMEKICKMPTMDAGKSCTDSDQCESYCYDPEYSSRGTKVMGECHPSSFADCIAVIEDGVVMSTICS